MLRTTTAVWSLKSVNNQLIELNQLTDRSSVSRYNNQIKLIDGNLKTNNKNDWRIELLIFTMNEIDINKMNESK